MTRTAYHLDTLTGSTLTDSDGRSMGPELAGRAISRHHSLVIARRMAREENMDNSGRRVVVVDTATGRIVE